MFGRRSRMGRRPTRGRVAGRMPSRTPTRRTPTRAAPTRTPTRRTPVRGQQSKQMDAFNKAQAKEKRSSGRGQQARRRMPLRSMRGLGMRGIASRMRRK